VSDELRLRTATERMALARAFGVRLRELRLAAGMPPSRLARKCRLSPATVKSAEHGHGQLTLWLILVLCDGLGVTPDELIGSLPVPREHR
jgi:transcriptional regulator with XRE-family HTH domain